MTFTYRHDPKHDLDLVRGDGLDLTVRRQGAEAIGLTRHHRTLGNIGLLWNNANPADPPAFWKSHAPILFPIVGGIKDGRSRTQAGDEIRFERLHGFVRLSTPELIEAKAASDHFQLRYRLTESPETLARYPWRFCLEIIYRLFFDRLELQLTIENHDRRPMPYQVGWHPGFNTPLVKGEKADCHLVLTEGTALRMGNDADCHLTGENREVKLSGDFNFNEQELDGTYMFDLSGTAPQKRIVELTDPDRSVGVRLRFGDYPHLGLWSDAGAPFICLEPWQGMDDHARQEPFDQKFGVVILKPGGSDSRTAVIEVI